MGVRPSLPLACAWAWLLWVGCAVAGTTAWKRMPSGLEVRSLEVIPSAELPVEAWLVRLDPARHELRALPLPPVAQGRPSGLASIVAEASGALAVLNASYFDEQGRPLGLLVADGRQLSSVNRQGWAWAALSAQGDLILREARADLPPRITQAVQAGPLLVAQGKVRELTSPRAARRSFLGTDASGRIVLGATNGAISLRDLAILLARPEGAGGAGLVDAMNLDGGSSTQLHVAGESPPLKVAGVPVPVFVGAFARSPPPDSR